MNVTTAEGFGKHFAQLSDEQNKASLNWIVCLIFILFIAGWLVRFNHDYWIEKFFSDGLLTLITKPEQVYLLIAANLPIGILVMFSLVFCSKNYRMAKHNAIVNKHRQHCMSTATHFMEHATDADFGKQVMLKLIDNTFQSNPSGFIQESLKGEDAGSGSLLGNLLNSGK
jgi:hypothetical protein